MGKPIKISGGGPSTLGCLVLVVLLALGGLSLLWPITQVIA